MPLCFWPPSSQVVHIGRTNGVWMPPTAPVGGGEVSPPEGALLDPYAAQLDGVYSLSRRLISSYTGPAFMARRDDGYNTEQDFEFLPNGQVNMASFAAWADTYDVYLIRIYNQKGPTSELPDITQTNAALQGYLKFSGEIQLGSDGRLCCRQSQYAHNMEMVYGRDDLPFTVGGVVKGRPGSGSNGMFSVSSYSLGAYPVGDSGTQKGIFTGIWLEGGAAGIDRTVMALRASSITQRLSLYSNGIEEILYTDWYGSTAMLNPIFGAGGASGGQCCENIQEFWVALSYLDDPTVYNIQAALT